MPLIGIRELRERASEVLRRVREDKAEYIITHQGRPIALLLPINSEMVEASLLRAGRQSRAEGWEVYDRLAREIRQRWPAEETTQDLLDEIRR
jgi:prevent-host-death family protein